MKKPVVKHTVYQTKALAIVSTERYCHGYKSITLQGDIRDYESLYSYLEGALKEAGCTLIALKDFQVEEVHLEMDEDEFIMNARVVK